MVNDLRAEVSGLVDELRNVNARYEEALEAKEKDAQENRELQDQVRSWKSQKSGT